MHELSIAEALVESVGQELRGRPPAKVLTVHIRIGALRLVVPETLETCFEAATRGTPLAGAHLDIEQVVAKARCLQCGAEFDIADQWFECPFCHTPGGRLRTGREMDLVGIELQDPNPAAAG
jgi:hydrogenase nickel incorporation protein HypA/HybF